MTRILESLIELVQRQGLTPHRTHGEWHLPCGDGRFLNLTTLAKQLAVRQ